MALFTGVLCFITTALWTQLAIGLSPAEDYQPSSYIDMAVATLLIVVLSPIIESIPFASVLIFIRMGTSIAKYGFLLGMFAFGWWIHGSGSESIGQGAVFGILAYLMFEVTSEEGVKFGVISNILAHFTCNLLVIIIYTFWVFLDRGTIF